PLQGHRHGAACQTERSGDLPVARPAVLQAQDLAYASHRHSLGWHRSPRSSFLTSRAPSTRPAVERLPPSQGWPTSNRNGRDQIGISGRLHSGIGGRLPPEYAVKGKRIGVDASTMEANAALRSIVRREDGRSYREMLMQMAKESGIETPSADDLTRIDRNRKGKKLSNTEWISRTDPEAKIAKLKDGRTHLAYKPEHAVDLDTGVIVAATLHPADAGDTTTIADTRSAAENNLAQINAAPTSAKPSELVTDKGYYSRAVLKDLDGGAWKTRIAEPKQRGFSRWHGDDSARAAVYANRTRLGSAVGKQAMRRR